MNAAAMLVPTVVSDRKSSSNMFRMLATLFLFYTFVYAQNGTCPGAVDGSLYTDANGDPWTLYCDNDWITDITSVPNTPDFDTCLLACDSYVPAAGGFQCGAVAFLANICYLKKSAADGGYLANNNDGASVGVKGAPVVNNDPPIAACPYSNNTVYTDANGLTYTVQCGLDTKGNNYNISTAIGYNATMGTQYSSDDYPTVLPNGTYQECFYQCGLRTGCLGFSMWHFITRQIISIR